MPLDAEKREIIVGKVNIIASRCKGCGYCIEFCPEDVLEASKDFNEKGYYPPQVRVEGRCVNCTYCETICPEFAVFCTVAERRPLRPGDMFDTRALSRREIRRRSLAPGKPASPPAPVPPERAAAANSPRRSPGGAGE
jgi:2-oxoglutarate ferredoxin oxidoreductase subunit delta